MRNVAILVFQGLNLGSRCGSRPSFHIGYGTAFLGKSVSAELPRPLRTNRAALMRTSLLRPWPARRRRKTSSRHPQREETICVLA
jgi:hypothetical protein